MKNSILLKATFVFALILIIFFPCTSINAATENDSIEWETSINVSNEKPWTITFNSSLDESTIHNENVFVKDEQGNKLNTTESIGEEGNQITIRPPAEGYTLGKSYTLFITRNVKDYKGNPLKKEVRKIFTVANDTKASVKNADDLIKLPVEALLTPPLDNIEDSGMDSGTLSLDAKSAPKLQVGNVMIIAPNEQYPGGLARKVESIVETGDKINIATSVPYLEEVIDELDINQSFPLTAEHISTETLPDEITIKNFSKYDVKSASLMNGLSYTFNDFPVTLNGKILFLNGSIELQNPILNPEFKFKTLLTGVDSFQFTLETTVVSKLTFEMEKNVSMPAITYNEIDIPMGKLKVPIAQIPGLTLDGSISSIVKVGLIGGINATLSNTTHMEVGFEKKGEDYKPIRIFNNQPSFSTKYYGGLEVKFGVRAALGASYLGVKFTKMANDTGLYGDIFSIKGTIYTDENIEQSCLASDLGIFNDLSLNLTIGERKIYKINLANYKLPIYTVNTCDMLQTLKFNESEVDLQSNSTKKMKVLATIFNLKDSHSSTIDVTEEVSFNSSDSSLTISQDGNIKVQSTSNNKKVTVTATYKKGDITKTASLVVNVLGDGDGDGDEIVNFLDDNLEKEIRRTLNIPTRDITKEDMKLLTTLYISKLNIKDLTGIENAVNLDRLELIYNQISDLSALSNLTNLRELILEHNEIRNISALSNLTNLTGLMLNDNQISDVSVLSNLTNLTWLRLGGNQISDISALSNFKNLDELSIEDNQISDISALSNFKKIDVLYLDGNPVSDISALSDLTSLRHLNLGSVQVSDISALSDLTNLRYLSLYNNQISDIRPLSNLMSLKDLNLNDNQIIDISALRNLNKLEDIELNDNQIIDISVLSDLTNIWNLYLEDNQISDISPLISLNNLKYLYLSNNKIKDRTVINELEKRGVFVSYY